MQLAIIVAGRLKRALQLSLNFLLLLRLLLPDHLDSVKILLWEAKKFGQERGLVVVLNIVNSF